MVLIHVSSSVLHVSKRVKDQSLAVFLKTAYIVRPLYSNEYRDSDPDFLFFEVNVRLLPLLPWLD